MPPMAMALLSLNSTTTPLLLPPPLSPSSSSSSSSSSCFSGLAKSASFSNFRRPFTVHSCSSLTPIPLSLSHRFRRHRVRMAPEEEKMTRRSPLDFPIEWERPKPGRRPDIFPQFSPMKTPLPPPLPADPPEEDEEEEEKKEEQPEEDPEKEETEKPDQQ